MTRTRSRLKPALSMSYLDDQSGGEIVDVLTGVTAFTGHAEEIVSTLSGRKAFGRVVDGVCEIIAKADASIALPVTVNGVIAEMGEVVATDAGMSLKEANAARMVINGYIETAAFVVAQYAASKGVPIEYSSRVAGDFMVQDGKLIALDVKERSPSRPGLGKAEMDAALSRWADCLATLAAVVNAEPQVPTSTTPTDETSGDETGADTTAD